MYDAFISYSHAADSRLAPAIERGLQRLARPWNRLRAVSVFRDQSDLALTPDLWSTISDAIDGSRYFVLLASPESAASEWVNREVAHWCDTKGSDHLLVVLTGGEVAWEDGRFSSGSTAVPAALHGRFSEEPLYLDLRWARDAPELSLRLSRFRAAVAQIASPIRGVPPDELEGEDIRQHRRASRLARAAVATVAALAVVAVVAAVIAVGNARRADRRAREALGRQIALTALDLPTGDVDEALLLSLAAAELQGGDDAGRFQASRGLIGRYSRLVSLLHAPQQTGGEMSLRAVAIASDGSSIVAAAWLPDGSAQLLSWPDGSRDDPAAVPAAAGHVPALAFVGDGDAVLLGAAGAQVTVVDDGAAEPLADRVVALEPRTARAMVIEPDASIALVDVATGVRLATVDGLAADVEAGDPAVDLTAERAAVAADGRVVLLESATGAVLATASDGSGDDLVAIAAGRDDEAAVVGAIGAGSVTTWRRDGALLVAGDAVAAPDEIGGLRRLVPSPDGRRVLAIGVAGSALVDLTTGASTSELGAGGLVVADPSRRYVAVGGTHLTVWDLATGQRAFAVPEPANALAWSGACEPAAPCRLASAGESLDVWEPTTGRRVRLVDQTNAQAVAISADGKRVVTAGWGSTVAVWALESPVDDSSRVELAAAGSSTAVDPAGEVIARYDGGSAVEVTTAAATTRVETGPLTGLQLAAGGERLLTATGDGLRLYATADGATVALDPRCAGELFAVSPGGSYVVTYDPATAATVVCDARSGSMLAGAVIEGAATPVAAVAVDDSGDVALGGGDGVVVHHRVDGGAFRGQGVAIDVQFGGEPVEVTALALRDGTIAAGIRPIGGRGAVARVLVWDAVEGGAPVQFDTDYRRVAAVGLLGAGAERVAVAGADAAGGPVIVQVWETATRRRLGRALGGLEGAVASLGGDESRVVGVDAAGRALGWSLDTDPTAEICGIVGRALERDEWETIASGALAGEPFTELCGDT